MTAVFSPFHIAVVEDDDGLRSAILRILNACGWNTTGFASAEAFLAAPIPQRIDCMVLDLYLPGMSGFDLFDRIAPGSRAPAIFITAQDDEAIRLRIQNVGERYLPKPFTGHALAEKVRECLGLARTN